LYFAEVLDASPIELLHVDYAVDVVENEEHELTLVQALLCLHKEMLD